MPRKTPKSRDETKKETREALIRAGLAAFQEDGLDASLDDICDRAGFTRGAFYVHFADREALLVAVMEHVGEAFLASVFAGMDSSLGGGGVVSLRTVAERFVASVKAGTYPLMPPRGKKPMVSMQQLLAACARSKKVRERYGGLVEASSGAVQALAFADQQSGAIRNDVDPTAIGQLMLAVIIGAQTMGELGVTVDPEALTRAMLTMIAKQSSSLAQRPNFPPSGGNSA